MGQDPTTFEVWWSGPNIGGPDQVLALEVNKSVTDVSAMSEMSPDMLVIAFHFSPLN